MDSNDSGTKNNKNNNKRKNNDENNISPKITKKSKRKSYVPSIIVNENNGNNSDDDEFIDIILGKFYDKIDDSDEEDDSNYEKVTIKKEINDIKDLINLGEMYNKKEKKKYNINIKKINKLLNPLNELNNMIGMKNLKQCIVNQIIYFLQDFEERNSNMMHSIIEGPPGSGKTDIANILAKIYSKLGILKHEKIEKVKRSDLIGQYLGQTAIKTQKAIDNAKGGILLIDEAYSLGNPEGRDSFSKECIDTLNQNLSEEKANFICIIVGYKDSLKKSFFSYNAGLERRFPFRYTIDEYTYEDLKLIFDKQAKDIKWDINAKEKELLNFFKKNRHFFKYNGGDLETLLQCCKIAHSKRVFCLEEENKKKLTIEDMKKGLEILLENDEIKNRSNEDNDSIPFQMYS